MVVYFGGVICSMVVFFVIYSLVSILMEEYDGTWEEILEMDKKQAIHLVTLYSLLSWIGVVIIIVALQKSKKEVLGDKL